MLVDCNSTEESNRFQTLSSMTRLYMLFTSFNINGIVRKSMQEAKKCCINLNKIISCQPSNHEQKEKIKNKYHDSGVWYKEAELPKHEASMSVLITPGLSATIPTPLGNSFATDLDRPSTAHFEAQ